MSASRQGTRRSAERQALQEALRQRREAREARRRRVFRLVLLIILVGILLCLGRCSCQDPPPPEVELSGPLGSTEPVVRPVLPQPTPERIEGQRRPSFQSEAPPPLPWLASFRMQVAARGPRLAGCFVGVAHPGAMRWTTSVEPGSGRVSDHLLEATLQSEPLTQEQRRCAIEVLSNPPYRIEVEETQATPTRVGIAIEF